MNFNPSFVNRVKDRMHIKDPQGAAYTVTATTSSSDVIEMRRLFSVVLKVPIKLADADKANQAFAAAWKTANPSATGTVTAKLSVQDEVFDISAK